MARVRLKGLLTLSQVARQKKTTRQAVWRAIRRGLLDFVDLSGRTLVVDNEKLRHWEPNRIRQKAAQARWKTQKQRDEGT